MVFHSWRRLARAISCVELLALWDLFILANNRPFVANQRTMIMVSTILHLEIVRSFDTEANESLRSAFYSLMLCTSIIAPVVLTVTRNNLHEIYGQLGRKYFKT